MHSQVADPTFFMKMLPLMDDGDDIAMVLSPQCFHNVHHQTDIFNHTNIHFWEYMQVGYDALGFISCTGERAGAACSCCSLLTLAVVAALCKGALTMPNVIFQGPGCLALLFWSASMRHFRQPVAMRMPPL